MGQMYTIAVSWEKNKYHSALPDPTVFPIGILEKKKITCNSAFL